MPKAPRLDHARISQNLRSYLMRSGPVTAKEACAHLQISQPAFSRLAKILGNELVKTGRGSRAVQYALRRPVVDVAEMIPIHQIDEKGTATKFGDLDPIFPRGFFLRRANETGRFFSDLPYLFDDLRPSGFIGRTIPRRHPELHLPHDIQSWSADDGLRYLVRHGWNTVGNLILGDEAFRAYLEQARVPTDRIDVSEREKIYPKIADQVMEFGVPGSSAGGEQPKFLAVRAPDLIPVLVKFSPAGDDPIATRLKDLLACEYLAHQTLAEHGQQAAKSILIRSSGRVFLEVERFDRVGVFGRRGMVSLKAIDLEFVGQLGPWSETAGKLYRQGRIDKETWTQIQWIELFGELIANSDMHPANLSFFMRDESIVGLAPVYDMLPMLYAPQQGQLTERQFKPKPPVPSMASAWKGARRAAVRFWSAVETYDWISQDFKAIARQNRVALESFEELEKRLP